MLIEDWKKALRFFSVQVNLLGGSLATGYAMWYPQLKDTVSPDVMGYITGAVFALGIVGRVVSQQPKGAGEDANEVHP